LVALSLSPLFVAPILIDYAVSRADPHRLRHFSGRFSSSTPFPGTFFIEYAIPPWLVCVYAGHSVGWAAGRRETAYSMVLTPINGVLNDVDPD
jgi:hypothetical protein